MTIPTRTFVARFGTAGNYGSSIFPTGFTQSLVEKHVVWLNDHKRKRICSFGGDNRNLQEWATGSQAANAEVYSYNSRTNAWAMVSPYGRGPGTFTPMYPNDAQAWVHDTKRDRYWTCPGIWFPISPNSIIQSGFNANPGDLIGGGITYVGLPCLGGGTRFEGLLWQNPDTGTWTPITSSAIDSPPAISGTAILNGYQGIYDPHQDCIMTVAGQTTLRTERIFLNDTPSLMTKSVVGIPYDGSGGAVIQNPFQQQPCFDILGRKGYVGAAVTNSSGFPADWRLWRYDLDNPGAGATQCAPVPAVAQSQWHLTNHIYLVFDTFNRKVIWPYLSGIDGESYKVVKMLVYSPNQNSWEQFDPTCDTPAAGYPYGNTWVFDEIHNCVLGGGSHDDPAGQSYFFLWRYA